MALDFPATRWSLIAKLPGQPDQVSGLLSLYTDAIGAYLQMKLPEERGRLLDDVVQEVLLDLLSKPEVLARAKPGSGSRFRYYLMHVAWQSALNHLRYHRQRDHASLDTRVDDRPSLHDSLSVECPRPDQEEAMDRAWALSVVQQSLDEALVAISAGRLDRQALDILQANLIEGRSLREIAGEMALSLATCSRRLAQARQFLKEAIAERLRLAGELHADDSVEAAGDHLLSLLAPNTNTAR